MSIIDLIKEQQLLTLTIGMSLLPMVLAVLMVIFTAIRHGIKTILKRRAAAKAQRLAAAEDAKKQRQERKAAAQEAKKQRRLEKAAALKAEHDAIEAVGEALEDTAEAASEETLEEDEEDENEEETSGAMQEILDSVFGTEEQDQHYKTLLEDINEIDIDDLANLAESVAEQLHRAS